MSHCSLQERPDEHSTASLRGRQEAAVMEGRGGAGAGGRRQ